MSVQPLPRNPETPHQGQEEERPSPRQLAGGRERSKWPPMKSFLGWSAVILGGLFMFGTTMAVLYHGTTKETLERMVKDHFRALYGIPMMSICSLLLVSFLRVSVGPIELELPFNIKLKGASGPIVLWVLCYLAMVASLMALW